MIDCDEKPDTSTVKQVPQSRRRRLAGIAEVAQRKREVADELVERMRTVAITHHPLACIGCRRVKLRWRNRRCPLCLEYDRLHDVPEDGAAPERELSASSLSDADRDAFDSADVAADEADLVGDLERQELVASKTRLACCRAYVEANGNVSEAARKVGLDRKTLREHIRPYRDRLTAEMDAATAATARSESPSGILASRAALYGFGSNGKRIPRPADAFDVKCTSCGVKHTYCVSYKRGHCCTDCWHPQTMRVKETRFYTSRG